MKENFALCGWSSAVVLVAFGLCSCVSTPQGRKFDPVEGAKRFDTNLDTTIDRMQERYHNDPAY